jgi:hypothetical protein
MRCSRQAVKSFLLTNTEGKSLNDDDESETENGQYSDIADKRHGSIVEDSAEDYDYEGFSFLQLDIVCSIQEKAEISKSWILLDKQSTVNVRYPIISWLLTSITQREN